MITAITCGCGGSSSGGPEIPVPTATAGVPSVARGRIAFVSSRDGDFEIYTMNGDGSGQQRLTARPGLDTAPNISADGSKVVFVSERGGVLGLYTLELDISGRAVGKPKLIQALRSPPRVPYFFPSAAFSRDGHKITYADTLGSHEKSEIFVVNTDGSGRQQLTKNASLDLSPTFSPGGRKIAFTALRPGDADFSIYMMDADGRNQKRLTNGLAYDADPDFSPDGQSIVFTSGRNSGAADSQSGDIFIMKADGSGQRQLTNTADTGGTANAPSFGSVGREVIFAARLGIYSVNASGGHFKQLAGSSTGEASPSAQ
jgi:TolB protein